jgi:hypothetical protein
VSRDAAPEKGGESMQQPIRYYITKSGEEPTVRSVKVARGVADDIERDEFSAKNQIEAPAVARDEKGQRQSVKRLVQGAIKKRIPAS